MTDNLSQQQIAEYIEAFDLFDTEGQGSLPLEKVPHVLQALGLVPNEYNIQSLQQSKLEEGETSIDCMGFLHLMATSRTEAAAREATVRARWEMLDAALATLDRTDTGIIQCSDLKRVMKDVLKGEDLESFLLEADKDGIGKVSYKELVGVLMQGV